MSRKKKGQFFNRRDPWGRGGDYLGADNPNWRAPDPEPSPYQSIRASGHQECAEFLRKGWTDFSAEKNAQGDLIKIHQEEVQSPRNPPLNLEEWIQKQTDTN